MRAKRGTVSDKGLLVILIILVLIIIALITSIIITKHYAENSIDSERESDISSEDIRITVEANNKCSEIVAKYLDDSEYDLDTIVAELEQTLSNSPSSFYKINFAICSAGFLEQYSNKYHTAISFLESAADNIDNVNNATAMSYYVTLKQLYEKIGDTAKVNYYNEKLNTYVVQEGEPLDGMPQN